MPILPSSPITVFNQDDFHSVDRVAKGHSFDIHNQMGRFLDEKLYQNELANRLQNSGHFAEKEVKVILTLEDFSCEYYIDLLIDSGVIIETKATRAFTSAHRAQVLNYLYVCGLNHATIINFRTNRVESEFVSTTLTQESRNFFSFNTELWRPLTPSCDTLFDSLRDALKEWGRGLKTNLYREYLTHKLGGGETVIQETPVITQSGSIGKQQTHILGEGVAFAITAATRDSNSIRDHQFRFLKHTNLNAIQWINMDRETITLETINKKHDSAPNDSAEIS